MITQVGHMLHMYIYTGFDETNILVSISFLYLNPISGRLIANPIGGRGGGQKVPP